MRSSTKTTRKVSLTASVEDHGVCDCSTDSTSTSLLAASLEWQPTVSSWRSKRTPVPELIFVLANRLMTMKPGQGLEHSLTNFRIFGLSQLGTDPRDWVWEPIHPYPWQAARHTHELELPLVLKFLRMRAATGEVAGMWMFVSSSVWPPTVGLLHASSIVFVVESLLSLFVHPVRLRCRGREHDTTSLPAEPHCDDVVTRWGPCHNARENR